MYFLSWKCWSSRSDRMIIYQAGTLKKLHYNGDSDIFNMKRVTSTFNYYLFKKISFTCFLKVLTVNYFTLIRDDDELYRVA